MKRRFAIWVGVALMPTLVLVGCGSDPETTPDTTPPLAPHLEGATFDEGTVGVWWQPNTEPDLAGYNVYLIEDGVERPAGTELITGNYLVLDLGPSAGTIQVYVTASDFSGNESSPSETMRAGNPNPGNPRDTIDGRPIQL